MNCSTSERSCAARSANSFAAFCDSCALSALRCLRNPGNVSGDLVAPLAASATLRVISLVVALCSSTAVAMVPEMSLIWVMTPADIANGVDGAVWYPLDGLDLVADVFGRFGRFGEFFDFIGDHGKAFPASPARAASIVAFSARSWSAVRSR